MNFVPTQRHTLGIAFLLSLLSPFVLGADELQPTKSSHSDGNPILGDGSYFSADAAPLTVDGKLYIYAGHDVPPPEVGGFVRHDYGVFVTEDPTSGDWALYQNNLDPDEVFDWATGNNAYAGHAVRGHDRKYYWYVPVESKNRSVANRMAIGVAVSDGPLGPWTDPIGKPLVGWEEVFGDAKIGQEVIDPHVFTDDDGKVYLYWGSWGVARVVQLDSSMTAMQGEITSMRGLDAFFEAPWAFKRNGNNLARDAKISASYTEQPPMSLGALNDGRPPVVRLPPDQWGNYRGKESSNESDWVQYDWDTPKRINCVGIQFHQDPNWIRPPASWKLEYRDNENEWKAVKDATCPTETDQWLTVEFDAIKTKTLRATFNGREAGPYYHCVSVSEWEVYAAADDNESEQSSGDQILDSIGETALMSRYVFDGDLDDWSRNGLNATAIGRGYEFVDDQKFDKVLSLPGGSEGAALRLPTSAIGDAVSFSVSGWVRVSAKAPGQYVFDLGTDGKCHLGLVSKENAGDKDGGWRIELASGDGDNETKVEEVDSDSPLKPGVWVHLVTVLDAAEKTLTLYMDGARAGRMQGISTSLASLFAGNEADGPNLYIGRSVTEDGVRLDGRLHDFRFYRIALSDNQVAVIHHNAISDEKITMVEEEAASRLEDDSERRAGLLYNRLAGVANIEVTTEVGSLPRLPHQIAGTYVGGVEGPAVRVIWPSPEDNSPVAEPTSYVVTGKVPGTAFEPQATIRVTQSTARDTGPVHSLEPFPLGQVVLASDENGNPTPFMQHRDKFLTGLRKTDPDRFLYVFRDAFGQPQPEGVRPLGVWDSQKTRLRGHATGHYLTAIAQAYATTSYDTELQAEFAAKMNYMIDVLHQLSQMSGEPASVGGSSIVDPTKVPPGPGKSGYDSNLSETGIRTDYWNWGKGFISGYPPDQFIMLERGARYGGGNDQVWAPYYTLHKILAGLVDCYEVGGNPKSLEVAQEMGVWVYERLNVLPQETRIRMWNSYIAGEYGGMNEIMARLYRITGDERFIESAKLFDNTKFFFGDADQRHGLAKNVDTIRGRHANQHIPQVIGALETYRDTQETPYYKVATNFWDMCVNSYMYSIGGVAGATNPNNAECFTAEPNTLFRNGLSKGGQNETCATYNLLKLARELFMFDHESHYMDYYERAIYNHILASVDDDNPGNTYHVPLNPGARKSFGNAWMDGFTCCNGTAIESGTKLQDSIYFKQADNRALYVNLFVPSTLDWKERDVRLTQSTNFPYADTSTLTLEGGGDFPISIRVPQWSDQGFVVEINGEPQNVDAAPGTYLKLERTWQDGDQIELKMPMSFHLQPLMDQPNIASLFYGPVLLAAEEPSARKTFRSVSLNVDEIGKSISGDPAKLRFQIEDTELKPFFEFYDGFHSAYLDIKPSP